MGAEKNRSLLLVGCGKMGSAMLSGLITDGLSKIEIAAVEPGSRLII